MHERFIRFYVAIILTWGLGSLSSAQVISSAKDLSLTEVDQLDKKYEELIPTNQDAQLRVKAFENRLKAKCVLQKGSARLVYDRGCDSFAIKYVCDSSPKFSFDLKSCFAVDKNNLLETFKINNFGITTPVIVKSDGEPAAPRGVSQ